MDSGLDRFPYRTLNTKHTACQLNMLHVVVATEMLAVQKKEFQCHFQLTFSDEICRMFSARINITRSEQDVMHNCIFIFKK